MTTERALVDELSRLTYFELTAKIPDEATAITYIEAVRWPHGPACSHCGCTDVSRVESTRNRPVLYCLACHEQFSITTGTVMEDTHIPLNKWLMAFHLMCASKKGISSLQLQRMLGLAYRSAWFLSHRIRHAVASTRPDMLTGTVEADEVYPRLSSRRVASRSRCDPRVKFLVGEACDV